jgi:nicotinate-nucleotide--dimethylbenzimidazole phosphoribosyltransferase
VTDAQRVLVLGGTGSGKSEFAERLLAADGGDLRYLATGRDDPDDAEWQQRLAEHKARRGDAWQTVECGKDPEALMDALGTVPQGALVLVDDLGGWVSLLLEGASEAVQRNAPGRLARVIRFSPARRLVVVSPEVGLSVVPDNAAARRFTDLLGACNRAAAGVCDAAALVVAGRTVWLPDAETLPAPAPVTPAPAAEPAAEPAEVVEAEPIEAFAPDDDISAIKPPDRIAINELSDRLGVLATGGAGLGALLDPVAWVGGSTGHHGAFTAVRVVLVGTDHDGGAAAGDAPAAVRRAAVEAGTAPLARLAERTGATVTVADLAGAGFAEPVPAMETVDVLDAGDVDRAFELGRTLAGRAADEGVDLLVPAACGAGVAAAATAVLAAATGTEPAGLLGRVVGEAGAVDDEAWIARCVAARDALHRIRTRARDSRALLAMVGGPDLAALTGLLIGAAVRQLPVLVDGPAAAAAMILARDLAPSAPWWCLVPDSGRHPALKLVCDLLGIDPFLDLGLGLGDGTTALAALQLLQPMLALAEQAATA